MARERRSAKIRRTLAPLLEKIAGETGTNRSEVIRQALALMKVAHEGKKRGKRIGLVSDPEKLETEIVGLL